MQNNSVKGTLVRWKDDKGFGFIHAEPELERDVFIHASSLSHMNRRPIEGDLIYFQIEQKADGKLNAVEASIHGVEVKMDLDENVKTKKGLRSQQRDSGRNSKRGKTEEQPQSPIKGILYRICIMMLLLAGASFAYNRVVNAAGLPAANTNSQATQSGIASIAKAYQDRLNGVQVSASGTVIKLLADDNDGSRHQRFILRLANDQTLLVAHNIDLAPRVEDISLGDLVEFTGQYEFNNKGGVIHWTHHDPQARHPDGWLKHNGQTYQ
ncbi:MAG: cold shock CspA family protein [Shewanella sp.]|jgi:cold shock CspA family protein